MAPIDTPEAVKPKKEKKNKSAKKRAREDEAAAEERKHKKSKSVAATSPEPEQAADTTEPQVKDEKKQKKKKKDKTAVVEDAPAVETPVVEDAAAQRKREKKEKKRKQKLEEANGSSNAAPPTTENDAPQEEDKPQSEKKDKKKKKDKKHAEPVVEQQQQQPEAADPDPMEVDSDPKPAPKSNKIHQPSDIPSNPQFPFYKQTVSLYEPIFPNGWAKPITGCESQHLRHLRNRYVPSLRGVLLDYENITLGEVPGRKGAAHDDESPTLLTSKAEFGGAFGWMTADVELFVPSRGAWMEGSVNLQTEGHIGVVCFGKFNASIEARRLPPSWKWVSDEDNGGVFDETASVVTGAVPDEHGVVRQIHSTGYWVDEAGDKVAGKTRFRIRNFDVGISGDSTYLSLQGTMLDRDSEKKLVAAEAKDAKERRARRGGGGKQLKRTVPDFSMTKFDYVEEEGQDQQQAHDVQQALELPEGADGGDLATETE
ncbi:uncharacterized protein F5Z01DRAFT_672991 [Emericellopsis atlantica]|uniref:RPA43 OB domain-containing protein n=1 Tax=Emericellopsis atlantica TaxID=2614577 RepID=A0A9P8CQ94_9HYPO|nr:uncharacterized protein F5Z01DRAFT_672991 [Emericellopsis atlantica]KAG9255689.1 hypothetical protein F5Z01DRAFT_672991 [Emericellopsis atlantica]